VKDNGDWWKTEARIIKKTSSQLRRARLYGKYSCGGARADWAGPPVVWLSGGKLALSGVIALKKAYPITMSMFHRKCSKLNV